MSKPLWQTLLDLALDDTQPKLSCEECYNLLDQYADILSTEATPSELMVLVKEHLGHCANCDELFESIRLMVQESEQGQ